MTRQIYIIELVLESAHQTIPNVIVYLMLWQPLDQCPIAAQVVNLTRGISSGEHKLCNSQENSTGNYNSILPTIYINYLWSVLQLHVLL